MNLRRDIFISSDLCREDDTVKKKKKKRRKDEREKEKREGGCWEKDAGQDHSTVSGVSLQGSFSPPDSFHGHVSNAPN